MKQFKTIHVRLALALCALAFITLTAFTAVKVSAPQNDQLDFTLVNKTGYVLKALYISPSGTKEWGEDVLEGGKIANGASLKLQFHAKATAKLWDISVGWEGYDPSEDVSWEKVDLTKYEKITLVYDEASGKTTAYGE